MRVRAKLGLWGSFLAGAFSLSFNLFGGRWACIWWLGLDRREALLTQRWIEQAKLCLGRSLEGCRVFVECLDTDDCRAWLVVPGGDASV